MRRTFGWLGVAVLVAFGPRDAAAISPYKMLQKLKIVDGAGSGLDSDTVQGQTPADIITAASGAAGAGVGTAIAAFLDSAYTRTATIPVSYGFCNTVDVSCDDANDFLLNCGGAVGLTTGYLTTVSEVPGANGTCRAGGCGDGGATSLAVTATCLVR
ncbi:MAG TPA: hypothetical protein VNO26_16345 [Candidatus Limnocylindria bacterium]|nr:hypothetical protein [Candidatus Limnocylindria bacterium]